MHEFAKTIIEEFERDAEPRDLRAVAELDHPTWVLDALTRFRIWAGVPGRRDSRRPSPELLEALFGRGRLALIALFRAYEAGTTPAESLLMLRALGAIVRTAQARKLIDWNIDNVKPDDGKGRLLVSFDSDLDAKLRAAAKVEEQTLSDFVRCAVQARVETIGKRRPRSAATA